MITLARPLDRYRALPSPAPWTGPPVYEPPPVIRTEPCACGGWAVQYLGEDIPTVVIRHQQTAQHKEWTRDRSA